MGRWRIVLPIAVALFVALLGGFLTYRLVKNQMIAPEGAKKTAIVPIAVAAIDLPWGMKLTKEKIASAKFLKETLPPGYFEDLAALEGRVLLSPLKTGEPILESRLAPVSVTTGGIAAVIKPGKRAIAVKGSKVIGLAGLIRPGNRVDVLVTTTDPTTKRETTKIVLEDMPVLAAGTQMVTNEKGEASPVDVYTLEVTPEDGERLAFVSKKGSLQFALRNPVDTDTVLTRGATMRETLASFRAETPQVIANPQRFIRPATRSVQVIKGTKVSEVKF
jgi:pilus assembly protein CpaB